METNQMENRLYIQMFGRFSVNGMGAELEEDSIHSEMLTKLMAYFLCHRKKEVTIQELVETLWNEKGEHTLGALKNLVYRLRVMLKAQWPDKEFIITRRGAYKWNEEIEVVIDTEEFEKCCEAAQKEQDMERKMKLYEEAVHMYKGMFLQRFSTEYWVVSLSTYYHSLYLSAVKAIAGLYEQDAQYKKMGQVCNYALQMDNLNESLQCYFIKALIHQNKFKLALEQYQKAVDALYENLGVAPSKELREVYEELLKQTHEEEMDIHSIQAELDDEETTSTFRCEYGVFKKIYQLEKRRSERLGISIYLSLITIVPTLDVKKGSQAYLNIISKGMEHLEKVLVASLRAGDVISKYSGTQYILLLPTCQYETAKLVTERIEREYALSFPKKMKTRLKCSLDEIDFAKNL